MERILTPEEKIRRAEEIYYNRKKSQNLDTRTSRINVATKKDFSLFKKMFIQIIICILIYTGFNIIKNNNLFSQDIDNKINRLISYDIDLKKWYNSGINYLNNIKNNSFMDQEIDTEEEIESNIVIQNEIIKQTENIIQNIEKNKTESVGGQEVEEVKENLSQVEKDAKDILNEKSLTIPLTGQITSRYGPRESDNPIVSKYHTGIDIAVNEGTIFVAAMEGTVKEVSSEGAYGNHVEIENGDVLTLYAHCKTIYVKQGDYISKGQQIGEVGATGNATGPHLHFEIKKQDRYVDPDLVLQFN